MCMHDAFVYRMIEARGSSFGAVNAGARSLVASRSSCNGSLNPRRVG